MPTGPMMIIKTYKTTVCIMMPSGYMGLFNYSVFSVINCNTSDLLNGQVIKQFWVKSETHRSCFVKIVWLLCS